MPKNVILDAMLARDDFAAIGPEANSADSVQNLSVESFSSNGLLVSLLRKPDFQRETNHWEPEQVVSFLESYLDSELIPSVILWRSSSHVFVIDGGHRVSALRAWIEDDYGDGPISLKFYSNNTSNEQKKNATKTRSLVEQKIGRYVVLKSALDDPKSFPPKQVSRARNMATRSLSLQWVTGNADKAESSFFKINTQGTPLDKTEELLLKNRRRSVAIAARSVVRAATGHNYWSKFDDESKRKIEVKSKALHSRLFNPEVERPLKTLDLPLGGAKSPVDALELLMSLICITNAPPGIFKKPIGDFNTDESGSETITVLDDCLRVVERVSGQGPGSLGLHPAIYYYSERGRHIPDLLSGMLLFVRRAIQDNNAQMFKDFTTGRSVIEQLLIQNKGLITQALQIVRSQTRPERVADFLAYLVKNTKKGAVISETDIVRAIAPNSVSKLLAVSEGSTSLSKFSDDAKSAIFINSALSSAVKCKICDGYLDVGKSVSFDHVVRVRDGGLGTASNGQLTHPYCNTGIKN